MLELVGIVVTEKGQDRLHRTQLVVRPGEVLGVVGPNHSGKSTLLEVCAGCIKPARGQILMGGRDVTRRLKRLRDVVGLMSQNPLGPLDLAPRVWLKLWAELDGVPSAERSKRIDEAAEAFDVDMASTLVSKMSAGGRKRLELARVWVHKPKIAILDQVTDGLDGHGLRRVSTAIRDLTAGGGTVILADSSPHLPVAVCDRVVIMQGGTVTAEISRSEPQFQSMIASAQGWAE